MDDLPVHPGTYAVILDLAETKDLQIGRLGMFEFPMGIYVYLGSARGPGGLRARLSRHLLGGGKPHWHIDYLVASASLQGYAYVVLTSTGVESVPSECFWYQELANLPDALIPVPKFGASDCRSGCSAHLVNFMDSNFLKYLPTILNSTGGSNFFLTFFGTRFLPALIKET